MLVLLEHTHVRCAGDDALDASGHCNVRASGVGVRPVATIKSGYERGIDSHDRLAPQTTMTERAHPPAR
jgi:hypothetical protein